MAIDEATERALIEIVRYAARTEILPRFRQLGATDVSVKTGPEDLVTEADTRAEAQIAEAVRSILPDALIVGEEAAAADPTLLDGIEGAALSVIIDPVDGTWNFAKGLTTFGVILAVVQEGETVFGLLYDPIVDDWVWTRRGGGTWHEAADGRARKLTLGPGEEGGMTGFLPLFNFPEPTRSRLAGELPGVRRIWSVRCSCHEYRTMAFDAADFCVSSALKPWDHAAGVLAVEEAGGAVGLLDGRSYNASVNSKGVLLSARSPKQLDELRHVLKPLITETE
ncbi:MAG: inositol monophosphatase family protein [Pseudomonadota bacterium]